METPSLNSQQLVHCCACDIWSVSSGLPCWIIAFCYLKWWYPVYCNELDHFLELSAHLIEKLGLHCPGLFLLVSFGAPLLKKWARELSTVDESLWLHVKNRVNRDTVIRNVSIRSKSCPVVWILIDCFCSVAGCTCDRVTNFEPDTTFPALVKAIWVIFEKSWKIQKSLKKALAWSWRQLSATEGYFSDLCGWRNVLCHFLPSTIGKTEFDFVQTHVLNENPENARKTISVNLQYFHCTEGRPKKPSFSNGRDPVDLPGCKRGKSHGSKKIAGRGHKLWTPLGLRKFILNSSSQQRCVPGTHSRLRDSMWMRYQTFWNKARFARRNC